ncbi:hypothetical protein LTR94_027782, partial [Friedmanniomyces endolithicus]
MSSTAAGPEMTDTPPKTLRSRAWFDNPENPDMTALYLERYLNYGLTRKELQSNKPIIGIAQTGSDLSPCNRHHLVLAERVREGIREAGGIAMEFPVHPIQETGKRPTAGLDRNLAYLGLVESLYGYPLDGVVLTIGCDKTTPACLMAAATVDIPAIALSVGPMLNGWHRGERTGSGTIIWKARQMMAAGEIDYDGFIELVASSAPSVGYCNTMGTATTMNSLAEALGILDKNEHVAFRATFIVDPDNVIQAVQVNGLNVGRNPAETLRVLDALQTDELCPCNWNKGDDVLK